MRIYFTFSKGEWVGVFQYFSFEQEKNLFIFFARSKKSSTTFIYRFALPLQEKYPKRRCSEEWKNDSRVHYVNIYSKWWHFRLLLNMHYFSPEQASVLNVIMIQTASRTLFAVISFCASARGNIGWFPKTIGTVKVNVSKAYNFEDENL